MSTQAGQLAEQASAAWLHETKQWLLVGQNWKTRWCELDLIMAEGKKRPLRYHIIEVKYRQSTVTGSGAVYVTIAKQRQLARAAAWWQHVTNNSEKPYQIDVVEVSGSPGRYFFTLFENTVYL